MISWFSRNQSCVELSIAEEEYVATCLASCEVVWLRKYYIKMIEIHSKVTLKKMRKHHIRMKKSTLKLFNRIMIDILLWTWINRNLLIDASTVKEYLLMGDHNSMLVT